MSKASSTKSIQKRSTKPTIEEPSLLTVKAMKGVGGSKNTEFNVTMFYRTLKTGVVCHEEGADPEEEARIGCIATGHALAAFKPTDEIEGMFAAQAVMLHNLSMEAGRRAMISEQPSDIASKLRKDAANSARAFGDMVDALARYRGKGPQVVRVERVIVNEGGQAVVGNVAAGTALPASGATPQAIAQGASPMPILDVFPIAARGRGGE